MQKTTQHKIQLSSRIPRDELHCARQRDFPAIRPLRVMAGTNSRKHSRPRETNSLSDNHKYIRLCRRSQVLAAGYYPEPDKFSPFYHTSFP
jgi:hypothetical protein